MDKLTADQQAKVKKMSDLRIKTALLNAGQDEGVVEAMNREQLMQAMAQLMLKPPVPVPSGAPSGAGVGPISGLPTEQFQM